MCVFACALLSDYVISKVTYKHFKWSSPGPHKKLHSNRELCFILITLNRKLTCMCKTLMPQVTMFCRQVMESLCIILFSNPGHGPSTSYRAEASCERLSVDHARHDGGENHGVSWNLSFRRQSNRSGTTTCHAVGVFHKNKTRVTFVPMNLLKPRKIIERLSVPAVSVTRSVHNVEKKNGNAFFEINIRTRLGV